MSKSNTFENELLLLLFNNTNIADIGDATGLRGSSTAGSLYIALHTADPGEAGSQTTSEATYGSYARQAVARNSGGFTVSGNQVSLTAAVTFPTGTSGSSSQNITWISVGVASSGTSKILYRAQLSTALYSGTGHAPQLSAGTGFTATED